MKVSSAVLVNDHVDDFFASVVAACFADMVVGNRFSALWAAMNVSRPCKGVVASTHVAFGL